MWKLKTLGYFAMAIALPLPLVACDNGNARSIGKSGSPESAGVVSMQNPNDPKEKLFGLPRRNSEGMTYPTTLDYSEQFQIGDSTYMKYLDMYWCQGYKGTDSALAHTLSESYRNEDDGFKKQDILKSLKPELDAYRAKAKKLGNIKIITREKVTVNQYNHETKTFNFISPSGGGAEFKLAEKAFPPQTYYSYILMGTLPYRMEYKPKSEAEARQIEGELSKLKDRGSRSVELLVSVYGYVLQTYAMDEGRQFHSVIAVDSFSLDNPNTKQPIIFVKSSLLPQAINVNELKTDSDIRDTIINRFKIPKSVKETPKGVPHFW